MTSNLCICIGGVQEVVVALHDRSFVLFRNGVAIEINDARVCGERYRGWVLGMDAGRFVDGLHFLGGRVVGFARGLNDTPKIVALLLAGEAIHPTAGLVGVALFMAAGGVLNSWRVAETMSRKITRINPGQGLTANLVTGELVTVASTVGSLFGVGVVNGSVRPGTVLAILRAWPTTMPTGAALAAGAYMLLRGL